MKLEEMFIVSSHSREYLSRRREDSPAYTSRPATEEEVTSEMIANFFHGYYEGENYHDLTESVSDVRRAMLLCGADESFTKRVMLKILEWNGI